jgi:hypothetical protein
MVLASLQCSFDSLMSIDDQLPATNRRNENSPLANASFKGRAHCYHIKWQ